MRNYARVKCMNCLATTFNPYLRNINLHELLPNLKSYLPYFLSGKPFDTVLYPNSLAIQEVIKRNIIYQDYYGYYGESSFLSNNNRNIILQTAIRWFVRPKP